jgi:hypothetical protein
MSIDFLSFGDLALATRAQAPAASSLGHTLTVQIRRPRNTVAGEEPMGGTLAMRASQPAMPGTLHAGVVAADALSLTITL